MDIKLTDVTLHIDENLHIDKRQSIEDSLRSLEGVVSVHNDSKTPHLAMIEYNPDVTSSSAILQRVINEGVHAELIGL